MQPGNGGLILDYLLFSSLITDIAVAFVTAQTFGKTLLWAKLFVVEIVP